jgi:primosomal replication protein N
MLNQTVLSAVLVEKKAKRFTPAGLPVVECVLAHESSVEEASQPRTLQFEIKAKAIGPIAERLESVGSGSAMTAKGFLAPTRQHSRQLMFHITDIELE